MAQFTFAHTHTKSHTEVENWKTSQRLRILTNLPKIRQHMTIDDSVPDFQRIPYSSPTTQSIILKRRICCKSSVPIAGPLCIEICISHEAATSSFPRSGGRSVTSSGWHTAGHGERPLNWFDRAWNGMIGCGTVWYGTVESTIGTRDVSAWYILELFGLAWCGGVWYGLVNWRGRTWGPLTCTWPSPLTQ